MVSSTRAAIQKLSYLELPELLDRQLELVSPQMVSVHCHATLSPDEARLGGRSKSRPAADSEPRVKPQRNAGVNPLQFRNQQADTAWVTLAWVSATEFVHLPSEVRGLPKNCRYSTRDNDRDFQKMHLGFRRLHLRSKFALGICSSRTTP